MTTTTLDRGGEVVDARSRTHGVGADAGDDRGRGRGISRHVSSAASGLLCEEDRRRSRLRSRAQERARAAASRRGDGDGARRRRMARHDRCACASCAPPATTCARWPTPSASGSAQAAHLAGLVRTRSGDFTLADAVGLDMVDRRPHEAAARVIPLAALLPSLPAITLTPEGASLAARGGFIGPSHVAGPPASPKAAVCGYCTRTGTWSPSPSRAPGGGSRAFFASGRGTGIKLLVWD